MVLEVLGSNSISVDGDVQVIYKTGKTVIYNSKEIDKLILNPDSMESIIVNKKTNIID